jgi:prepilin-type N-terminal cleavage/methylation domain-containing protein
LKTLNLKREEIMARAFTLIELLIVVAIIAILAAIAVPNFLEAQTRAKVSRVKADCRAIATALEAYATDNNKYLNGSGTSGTNSLPFLRTFVLRPLTTPIAYMSSVPAESPFGVLTDVFPDAVYEFHGYHYTGGKSFENERTFYSSLAPHPVSGWKDAHYLLLCIGPTKRPSNRRADSPGLIPYDPTNGTVSNGDIIYVGGASSNWHSFN